MQDEHHDTFRAVEWRVIDTMRFYDRAPNTVYDDPAQVEDPCWSAVIPYLHRALANPTGNLILPQMPRRLEAPNQGACAYWEAPLYMMRALLGWKRPGLGMLWFYQNRRKGLSDLRLQLLETCWNKDGQLDMLAAHLWREEAWFQTQTARDRGEPDVEHVAPEPNWWPLFKRRFQDRELHDPYFGGSNPLHLNHTRSAVRETRGATWTWTSDQDARRATLNVDRMPGWLGLLEEVSEAKLGDNTEGWTVDVVSRPVGWLGAFIRSPTTGLWHVGAEEAHLAGQPSTQTS